MSERFTTASGEGFLLRRHYDKKGCLMVDILRESDLGTVGTLAGGGDPRCDGQTAMATDLTGIKAMIAGTCLANGWARRVGAKDLGGGRYGHILRFDEDFLKRTNTSAVRYANG